MPWSAVEMLNGQRQRANVPAHAGTADKGLPRTRLELEEDRVFLNRPSGPPDHTAGRGRKLN